MTGAVFSIIPLIYTFKCNVLHHYNHWMHYQSCVPQSPINHRILFHKDL